MAASVIHREIPETNAAALCKSFHTRYNPHNASRREQRKQKKIEQFKQKIGNLTKENKKHVKNY